MTDDTEGQIQGKVLATKDKYTVLVNIGSDDGVHEKQIYGIYTESDPIEDPDTGEDLGRIEYKIAEVRPAQIRERLSTMETAEYEGPTIFPSLSTDPKPLTDSPDFDQGSKKVKKGQSVRLIEDERAP